MKFKLSVFAISVVVLFVCVVGVAAAFPAGIPANDIERGVFVDPVPGKGSPARGAKPSPGGGGSGEQNSTYTYKGIHWQSPLVAYEVNAASSGLDAVAVVAAVDQSFWSWQTEYNLLGRADASDITFADAGATTSSGPRLDGHNIISWAPLSSSTIAATYYWYDRRTKHLIEFDMVFNSSLPWSTAGEAGKYDVWNIGAHEAGHTLQLNDLYTTSTRELTMHGYGMTGETKKQTLGLGDMLGVERVYPLP